MWQMYFIVALIVFMVLFLLACCLWMLADLYYVVFEDMIKRDKEVTLARSKWE